MRYAVVEPLGYVPCIMVAPQDHVDQEESVQRTQKEVLSDMKLE